MPALRTNAARKQRYKGSSNLAYTALPDPTTHIRLLNIKRGQLADGIICSLSSFSLLEAPLYAAISYTWGESVLTHTITVDGSPVSIRENCHSALWQVRELKRWTHQRSAYIWIDSICINQDDLPEKGSQVQLMGRIFKQAYRVFRIAWHAY